MTIITYQIKLLQPVLVTSLEGDPNNAVSFDFLPGSVLRGALIGRWLHHNPSKTPLEDPTIMRLFFSGQTRYLNGYLYQNQRRLLPVPRSWLQEKEEQRRGNATTATDFAIEPVESDQQWKSISGFRAGRYDIINPERQVAFHMTRDRIFGRSRGSEDGVYQYEALSPGQDFAAAILCSNLEDAKMLKNLLEKTHISLGNARNSGYGRVAIEQVTLHESWREVPDDIEVESGDGKWIITLLSDLLIRNPLHGHHSTELHVIEQYLTNWVGTPVKLARECSFITPRTLGGFSRKWGLPLPQVQTVKMGSVLVFDAPDLEEDVIEALEWVGIGERQEDGFGRVAINWQQEEVVSLISRDKRHHKVVNLIETDSHTMAQRMTIQMLRTQLEHTLIKDANLLEKFIHTPTPSQLSRLRLVILDALTQTEPAGRERLQAYLDKIESRPRIKRKFSADTIQNKPLLAWLSDSFSNEKLSLSLGKRPKIGNVEAPLSPKLIYHYNLRLVELVLHLAAKRKQKEENAHGK